MDRVKMKTRNSMLTVVVVLLSSLLAGCTRTEIRYVDTTNPSSSTTIAIGLEITAEITAIWEKTYLQSGDYIDTELFVAGNSIIGLGAEPGDCTSIPTVTGKFDLYVWDGNAFVLRSSSQIDGTAGGSDSSLLETFDFTGDGLPEVVLETECFVQVTYVYSIDQGMSELVVATDFSNGILTRFVKDCRPSCAESGFSEYELKWDGSKFIEILIDQEIMEVPQVPVTEVPVTEVPVAISPGANLMQANLSGRDLRYADLRGANLALADLTGADLSFANLSFANLSFAKLGGLKLEGADLRGAILHKADLSGADLRATDLRYADLSDVNLTDTRQESADLTGAITGVQLPIKWKGQAPGPMDILAQFNVTYTGTDVVDLSTILRSDLYLVGVDLSGADLRGVDLSRAYLKDANLRYAILSGADLKRSDLSGADLRYADLTGAQLNSADLRGAKLSGAKLNGARLGDTDLTGADLRGADLTGASVQRFATAYLNGATMPDGTIRECCA
jgi:uncharacterized protein YjbI with pentapeptide repeats